MTTPQDTPSQLVHVTTGLYDYFFQQYYDQRIGESPVCLDQMYKDADVYAHANMAQMMTMEGGTEETV